MLFGTIMESADETEFDSQTWQFSCRVSLCLNLWNHLSFQSKQQETSIKPHEAMKWDDGTGVPLPPESGMKTRMQAGARPKDASNSRPVNWCTRSPRGQTQGTVHYERALTSTRRPQAIEFGCRADPMCNEGIQPWINCPNNETRSVICFVLQFSRRSFGSRWYRIK